MRKPKDRDLIETHEGLLFCVIGYLHPPKAYTAYLKYVPETAGKWSKGNLRYRRAFSYYHVMQVEETFGFLKESYPEYLFQCPIRNILISTVPEKRVKTYYEPEKKLQNIMTQEKRDEMEEEVRQLVELLSDLSGVKPEYFGVTGSVLLGMHNPRFSDIDLTVLGIAASQKVKQAMMKLTKEENTSIRRFRADKAEKWIREKMERFPLKREEAELFLTRRWNYGYFGNRYFSVHPIRRDEEIEEKYGQHRYTALGVAQGTGIICSSRESILLPAVYYVEDVKAQGWQGFDFGQVVSYEGLYSDVLNDGEQFAFRGLVELVNGGLVSYRRILIGSTKLEGKDYIKPIFT